MASNFKIEGNRAFGAGRYHEAISLYTRGISKDPTFVNLYTNRAMARFRIDAWEDCLDDCLKAIEMQSQNFKAYFYLAQAQLRLRHPNEALSSAITAYDIGLRTADQSTSKASELVLSAKKAKWEVRERERLRERNHLLRELEDSLLRNGDYESNQVIDPAIINEIQEATRRKIEELYSLFAISDPSNMTKREVPDYMIDQITFAFMYDPVITKSGQSYERTTIEAHLKVSATDPLTRQSLTVSELRSNLALKQACAEFLEENGWAVECHKGHQSIIPLPPPNSTKHRSKSFLKIICINQDDRSQNVMDKGVSNPQLIRSPLSSILNLSRPTSEERPPEDDIYNALPINIDHSSPSLVYGTENEVPQETTTQLPEFNQIHVRTSRSQSLDVHYPTQLDTIAEVSIKSSSRDNIRPQRSQSLDQARLQSRLFQTSTSNDGLNYLPIITQYPKQPFNHPPERVTTPPNVPRFNTIAASIYHIPSPTRTLRERLDGRPSPERLSWIRQTSGLPPGAVMRAGNGTLVSGLWQAPSSGHTGSNRHSGFDLSRNPFNRPGPLNMHPTNQARAAHPRDLGAEQREKKKSNRKRCRRV